ncbi:MAG: cytidine deaminase [Candidatus Zixiibacteriota bacterium]|nr:MAG: cytidine deaminase [candidate division Zixibacteria bacterium]
MIDWDELIESAESAARNAYAVYSDFKVGAAILTVEGKIFTGCNIENSSYGLTVCAERVAVFKAVSEGFRDFKALTVYSEAIPPARPCGACLQALSEFGSDIEILCGNSKGEKDRFNLRKLLPEGFTFKK